MEIVDLRQVGGAQAFPGLRVRDVEPLRPQYRVSSF